MKVVFRPAPGAAFKVKLADGKVLDAADVEAVEVEPAFLVYNGVGEIARCQALRHGNAGGGVIEDFVLVASGASGKVRKMATVKSKKVIPAIDRPRKAADAPKPG